MADPGSSAKIDDINRLMSTYGGKESDWNKISSRSYKATDGSVIEIHAYRNNKTGEIFEPKSIITRKGLK